MSSLCGSGSSLPADAERHELLESTARPSVGVGDAGGDKAIDSVDAGSLNASISSRRKAGLLLLVGFQQLLVSIALSIMAPIYPLAARDKFPGMKSLGDTFAIGMVLTVANFFMFLFAPLIGGEVPLLGPKRIAVIGQFWSAGLTILFGFMNDFHGWAEFMAYSYVLRSVLGIASACVYVSSFAVLLRIFPDAVSSSSAVLEVAGGVGFTVGPALGGAMFEHGSFKAAFLLCGGLQLAGAILLAVFVPPTEPKAKEDVVFSKLHVLKSPRCVFMLSIALLGGSTIAVWDPSLGPYLRLTFGLSPTLIGLSFLPAGIAHAITSPIMGQVADRISRKYVFLFGFLINVFAFALVGSHTLAGTKEQLWMVLFGSFLVGVGTPMSFVPTSSEIVDTMRRKGYEDSYALHGAVGGLLNSACALGLTVGPTVGSLNSMLFTFGDMMLLFCAVCASFAAVEILYLCSRGLRRTNHKAPGERESLIGTQNSTT